MAEFRNGRFTQADAALTAATRVRRNPPTLPGTSAFFLAMSRFRRGKPDLARWFATGAAARMKLSPEDKGNPTAGGGHADDLIPWMACTEAQALFCFDDPKP